MSLDTFLQKVGYLNQKSVSGYASGQFEVESYSEPAICPGFPFLHGQNTLTFAGSSETFLPENEIAQDETYAYFSDIVSDNERFNFGELARELEDVLQARNCPLNSGLAANAIGQITKSFGKTDMPDPDESEAQRTQLENGLRIAYEVIQKKMDERRLHDEQIKLHRTIEDEMRKSLKLLANECHGDRLRLALAKEGIHVSFSMNGQTVTREEMQKPFLEFYKILRKMNATGDVVAPSEKEQKDAFDYAAQIDSMKIYLQKDLGNGKFAFHTVESLCNGFPEDEQNYIKNAFFSSMDNVSISDINNLRNWYETNAKKLREKELAALAKAMEVCGRPIGPPVKDPSNRSKPWSKIVDNLERKISGYNHAGHLPVRLDLYLLFLSRNGYIIYSGSKEQYYTSKDILLQNHLPKDIKFYSTNSGQTYTLREILSSCTEIAKVHKDKNAFAEDEDMFYEYWDHEFRGAKNIMLLQDANRTKLENAYFECENDFDKKEMLFEMQKRRLYEEEWIQKRIVENNQKETENFLLGEYTFEPKMDSFANGISSMFGVKDFSKYVCNGVELADGTVHVNEVRECTPDPYILAQRAGDYVENEPRTYSSASSLLEKMVPPLLIGAREEVNSMKLAIQTKIQEEVQQQQNEKFEMFQNFMNYQQKQEEEQARKLQEKGISVPTGVIG